MPGHDGRICHAVSDHEFVVTVILTYVALVAICGTLPLTLQDGQPVTPAGRSGMRRLRAAARHCRSRAGPGIMPTSITTGLWGASTGLGQASADNACANHVPGSLAWT